MLQKIILSIVALLLFSGSFVSANEKIKIATIERQPFSYKEDGKWTGYSIELFEKVAEKNHIDYEYVEFKEFSKMLEAVRMQEADWAVANISITLEREKEFDFSAPIYDSGLNIMGLSKNSELLLFTSKYMSFILQGLLYLFIFIIALAHIFWIVKIVQWYMSLKEYFSDIIWLLWSIISQTKNAFWLRIFSVAVIVWSIFVVSYFAETFTLLLNGQSSNNGKEADGIHYSEIKDDKIIGVTKDSTAMSFLNKKEIKTQDYDELGVLYEDLRKKKIDYIVADDPILKYFSKNSETQIYSVIGKVFKSESYGFLFEDDSELLENINISILEMQENWILEELYKKYF